MHGWSWWRRSPRPSEARLSFRHDGSRALIQNLSDSVGSLPPFRPEREGKGSGVLCRAERSVNAFCAVPGPQLRGTGSTHFLPRDEGSAKD